MEDIKEGVWFRYMFLVRKSLYWYYGCITSINDSGKGKDGDWFVDVKATFPMEEDEPSVIFWGLKKGKKQILGWEILPEDQANGRCREKCQPEFDNDARSDDDITKKVDVYLASFKNKYDTAIDDLRTENKSLVKKQKISDKKISDLEDSVTYLTRNWQRITEVAHTSTIRTICERYMPVSNLDEADQSMVFPTFSKVSLKGPSSWKKGAQCANIGLWKNGKPSCDAAQLYVPCPTPKVDEVHYKPLTKEHDDNCERYWLTPASIGGYGYHVVITRMFRQITAHEAKTICAKYNMCGTCVGKRFPDACISAKMCAICIDKKVTQTHAVQDRSVSLCQACNDKCGRIDDLKFLFNIMRQLFPLSSIRIHTPCYNGYKPDTVVDFTCPLTETACSVILEVDTVQHRSYNNDDEIARKKTMAKYLLEQNPHVRILFIRFSPAGRYTSSTEDHELTSAERLLFVRAWVTWYIATAENAIVPPFMLLYMWYNNDCNKVLQAKEAFGEEFVGQTNTYPCGGVWKYYGISPTEEITFSKMKAKGVDVNAVFPRLSNASLPICFV